MNKKYWIINALGLSLHFFCLHSVYPMNNREKAPESLKKFCCTACERTFQSKQGLTRHTNGVHRTITCPYCPEQFTVSAHRAFNRHVYSCHPMNQTNIQNYMIISSQGKSHNRLPRKQYLLLPLIKPIDPVEIMDALLAQQETSNSTE